jgi:hypothetical protein
MRSPAWSTVFGDRVTLGGFIEVLVLVLTMILARLGIPGHTAGSGIRVLPKLDL